jgi:glycosyltransferase involved in cell wall biosynthesis
LTCVQWHASDSSPVNIALVTETFPPEVNGVAMTLRRLVEGVAARGANITVVRPRQAADREAARAARAERPATSSERDAPTYREWLMPGIALPRYEGLMMGLPVTGRLVRHWSAARPDVVHIATEGPLGWSALAAARKLGLPISSSFHTNFHQYGKHYGYGALITVAVGYLRYFHNLAHLTMVPTRQMAGELAAQHFRNLAVVSRGVDARLFDPARRSADLRRSWGAAPEDPVYLYVGRLAKEKNIDLAVASFLAARASSPRAQFVLVGDGPEGASLRKRYPEFHFAGLRRGEDLATHYASGDVFLFPSVTETFGNVVTEALGSGLVVVTYDYAAGREHIRHNENGILAPFDNAAAYRTAAAEIAKRATEWPRLRTAARATALTVTWDAIIDGFHALLRQVAAHGGRNGHAI